jgi:glycosyltransferase involved in cell wall biosynthesis
MLSKYSFEHENSLKKKLIHHSIGKFLLAKTFIHATASSELTEGKQLISQWQGFVLPNILPLSEIQFTNETNLASSPIKLLFLSRIDKKKGLELLFEALSKVSFAFNLDIIGTGNDLYIKELQQLATDYNIAQNIAWLGRIEGEKRFEYYAQADIFLLLSQNENFANVVIEALSQGTPVFISDNVGLADYVLQKQLGEITKLEVNEIVEKLQDFAKNQTLRKKIRDTAPTIIAQDFDKANVVKQYLYEYEKVRLANL